MPQQLIYTSAPQGIVAGRSGYCTVARSAKMREPLMLQLEKCCYYQHLSLTGGQERPICSCRIVDIRGTLFHVLSRIQDAGLDFTGRTNFIAHHLVFTPEEIRQFPTPPVILREWPGWVKSWTKDPQMLENEDWADLTALAGRSNVPAQTWQRVTGDAVNGYGLLEARAGASFRVDDQADETVLELIAESLELLEVRDPRRDFRTAAWNYTFTTSMQEQDNPADFRWRCIHSDNPAANRFATPDCRALSAVQATKWTGEETGFARTGRQPPKSVKLTSDKYDIPEGTGVQLEVATDGIPTPTIRWFEIERNQPKELVGTSGTIQILNPEGRSKRYQVQAFNSAGSVDSNVVEISIRAPVKIPTLQQRTTSVAKPKPVVSIDENPYETLNQKYEAEDAKQGRKFSTLQLLAVLVVVAVIAAGIVMLWPKHKGSKTNPVNDTNNVTSGTNAQTNVTVGPTVNQSQSNAVPSPVKSVVESIPKTKMTTTSPSQTGYPLPDGWAEVRIGTVSNPNADFIDRKPYPKFVLTASAEGFLTNGDSILFVCKTKTDKEFSASILTNDLPWASSTRGIMIRESKDANSPFLFIGVSSREILVYQRDAKGIFQSSKKDMPKANQGHPIILTLNQTGNQFVAKYKFPSISPDETLFQELAFTAKDQTLIGFGVYSGNNTNRAMGHFIDTTMVGNAASK
jgi:hypothetical protein